LTAFDAGVLTKKATRNANRGYRCSSGGGDFLVAALRQDVDRRIALRNPSKNGPGRPHADFVFACKKYTIQTFQEPPT